MLVGSKAIRIHQTTNQVPESMFNDHWAHKYLLWRKLHSFKKHLWSNLATRHFLKIEKSFDWKMFSGFLFFEAGQQTSENCSVENSVSEWVIRLLSRRQKNCDWPKFSTEHNDRRRLKWKLLTHDMSWGRWEIVERSTWPKTIELFFTKNTSLGLNLYRPARPIRLFSCSAGLRSP